MSYWNSEGCERSRILDWNRDKDGNRDGNGNGNGGGARLVKAKGKEGR